MKIGICAAMLDNFTLPEDLPYIGVDKGTEKLLEQGIIPAFAIGDFDSITDPDVLGAVGRTEILPARKDVTDTHAAVEWAIGQGYDEINIYGATGGRLDHFLAVLTLLELYRDVKIRIIDSQNEISLLGSGSHTFSADGYKYFSLYAPDRAVISISGAQYPLKEYTLLRSDPLCCSNEVKGKAATVVTDNDILLVKSKDRC